VALIVVLTAVVVLLAVLVAGLLRSHADILRALHSLGAGVGDPAADPAGHPTADAAGGPAAAVPVSMGPVSTGPVSTGQASMGPVRVGPPLPPERGTSTPTVAGVTPQGDALAVAVGSTGGLTLLAFLSTGCTSCHGFWQAFAGAGTGSGGTGRRHGTAGAGLPPGVDLLVVTKGPELEVPADVGARSAGVPVVMSTEAWTDYEVPGSPFFVLVDGADGRRIGEGIANTFPQVADLVRRAQADRDGTFGQATAGTAWGPAAGGAAGGGPDRERANDQVLRAAGILPGDRSLYPASLDDLYGVGRVPGVPMPRVPTPGVPAQDTADGGPTTERRAG